MTRFSGRSLAASFLLLISISLQYSNQVEAKSVEQESINSAALPKIPTHLRFDSTQNKHFILHEGKKRYLTLVPELQRDLEAYARRKGNHIAATVLIEVESGRILALAQGKSPKHWNSKHHSALYPDFPAASLFKTVGSAAALEIAELHPDAPMGLTGGCQKVRATPRWLRHTPPSRKYKMTLKRAYSLSCNGYFAKMIIKHIGLNALNNYADKFLWRKSLPADFHVPPSPIHPPSPAKSNVQTVGKYAAGFGPVGISAVHAAWKMLVIAANGESRPIFLFEDSLGERPSNSPLAKVFPMSEKEPKEGRILSEDSAKKLRYVMNRTTINGTAGFAFKRRPYRNFRHLVGGKTGTLTGDKPKGLTTWFSGMMPLKNPEVVVASVTVNGDFWIIKGAHLAAETLLKYRNFKRKQKLLARKANKKKSKLQ